MKKTIKVMGVIFLLGAMALPVIGAEPEVVATGEYLYPISIVTDTSSIPHLVYVDDRPGFPILYYGVRRDNRWNITLVDTFIRTVSWSFHTSLFVSPLSLDENGNPGIVYPISDAILYAYHDGTSWTIDTIIAKPGDYFSLEFYNNIPYILTYGEFPDYIFIYKREGDEWRVDSLEKDLDPVNHRRGLSMVIKDGTPHLFYVKDESPFSKFHIYTITWTGSWGEEKPLLESPRDPRYESSAAVLSKDNTIGIPCETGYGGVGNLRGVYIYSKDGVWEEESFFDDHNTRSVYFPALCYDTLNMPHIFAKLENEEAIYHFYKKGGVWEREKIVSYEDGEIHGWHIFADIDRRNRFHLTYKRTCRSGGVRYDTVYYITSSVSGIEEEKRVDIETINAEYRNGKLIIKMMPDITTELNIYDILGRKMDRIRIKSGRGEWIPSAKGVYFLLSDKNPNHRYRKKVVIW